MGYCFKQHYILPILSDNYENANQVYINDQSSDQSTGQSTDQSSNQPIPTIDQFITALCIMSVMFDSTD
jgi:capsular polysaccharide biosynthesis protein